MPRIHRAIEIDAPLGCVFDAINGPDRFPEFLPAVYEIQRDELPVDRVGGSFKLVYSVMGIRFTLTYTYTAFERNRRITTRFTGGMAGLLEFTTEAANAERTTLAVVITYQLPGGPLGEATNALLLERLNDGNIRQMMENIKLVVETQG